MTTTRLASTAFGLGATLLLCHAATLSSATFVPATSPLVYKTEYNWAINNASSSVAASNPGAYLRVAFRNSTTLTLAVNPAGQTTAPPTVKLAFTIRRRDTDETSPWAFAWAPSTGSVNIALAPLDLDVTYDALVVLYSSYPAGSDRWLNNNDTAKLSSFLSVRGFTMDAGGVAVPPLLRPKRCLVYGDSITEGVNAQNYDFTKGQCFGSGDVPRPESDRAASTKSWAWAWAAAMQCEISMASFAAQGFVTQNSLLYGRVPPLLTVGNPALSAWDKISAQVSRLPALTARAPDMVVQALGFNDQACTTSPAAAGCTERNLTLSVAAFLDGIREATSNRTMIFLALPFGGEMTTKNKTRDAILDGFRMHQEVDGTRTHLLDLYPASQVGLRGLGRPTAESCDGTHPLAQRHAQLGAMLAAQASVVMARMMG